MTLRTTRRPAERRTRRPNAHRLVPALDGLEARTVMSATVAHLHAAAAVVSAAPAPTARAPLTITNFTVQSVKILGNGKFVANAVLNVTVGNTAKSVPVSIPGAVSISQVASPAARAAAGTVRAAAAGAPVTVLTLSLGPVNLSVLGLNVHLGESCDFNNNTPIRAKIVAIPTGSTYTSTAGFGPGTFQGGLLGDLVGGLLGGGGGSVLNNLGSTLTGALNHILSPAAARTGTASSALSTSPTLSPTGAPSNEVLMVPLGPINLDLLGLLVQTTPICLNLTATPSGGLLGSLLG